MLSKAGVGRGSLAAPPPEWEKSRNRLIKPSSGLPRGGRLPGGSQLKILCKIDLRVFSLNQPGLTQRFGVSREPHPASAKIKGGGHSSLRSLTPGPVQAPGLSSGFQVLCSFFRSQKSPSRVPKPTGPDFSRARPHLEHDCSPVPLLWKEPGKGWVRLSDLPCLLCSGEDVWAIHGYPAQQEPYL